MKTKSVLTLVVAVLVLIITFLSANTPARENHGYVIKHTNEEDMDETIFVEIHSYLDDNGNEVEYSVVFK